MKGKLSALRHAPPLYPPPEAILSRADFTEPLHVVDALRIYRTPVGYVHMA
jgi:hypothetical protein